MKKIKLFLSVVALVLVTSVAAENNKAFIGADLSIMKYTGSDTDVDPTIMGGFSAGYLRTFPIGQSGLGVDVGAGIQYVVGMESTGIGIESTSEDIGISGYAYEIDNETTICNINIPIAIAYKIGSSDSFAFRPYAGINFRLGLSAKSKLTVTESFYGESESESTTLNLFDKDDMGSSDNTANKFKTGVIVGGDFEFSRWSVGYQWGSDFGDMGKNFTYKYSWHTLRFAFKF